MPKGQITVGEAVNAVQAISKLVKLETLPISLAYWITILVNDLNKHIESFHEHNNKLLKQLGKPAEKDGEIVTDMFQITPEYVTARTELEGQIVKLQIPTVRMSDLLQAEAAAKQKDKNATLGLSPADLGSLRWLIQPDASAKVETKPRPAKLRTA